MPNTKHALLSSEDIPNWQANADVRVLLVGDESINNPKGRSCNTFDVLISQGIERLTHNEVTIINLSEDAVGNDYIIRKLSLAFSKGMPDVVLIKFAPRGRREYMSISNDYLRFDPAVRYQSSSRIIKELTEYLSVLGSAEFEKFDFIRNALWIKAIIGNLPWWGYTACKEEHDWLDPYLKNTTFIPILGEVLHTNMNVPDYTQLQLAVANHFCPDAAAYLRNTKHLP